MIKRPLQQTKVHIVHKTIKKSPMTTDYVKRHGLKPTMRAFSVNDTMINGASAYIALKYVIAIEVGKRSEDKRCAESLKRLENTFALFSA